jgi:hypothetical protein
MAVPEPWWRRWLPYLAVGAAASGALLWMHGPLGRDLATQEAVAAFHGGHVWCFQAMWRMLSGVDPWSLQTTRMGFPGHPETRYIAWAPAVLAGPFQSWLGPLGAYHLAFFATPALGVLFGGLLARRVTGCSAWIGALAGGAFALCPYALGTAFSGQACKLQLWTIPATMLAFSHAVESAGWARLAGMLAAPIAAALTAFTEPTYALLLPLALGAQAVAAILAGPDRLRRILAAVLALALAGAAILPARPYYDSGGDMAFRPANRPTTLSEVSATVAHLPAVVTASSVPRAEAGDALAVAFTGRLAAVLGVLALLVPRAKGRGLAVLLVASGMTLSLGEWVWWNNQVMTSGGGRLRGPAWWLAEHGWPMARSGMYYRALSLASLGLPLAVAGALSRLPPRWGVPAAALAFGGMVAESASDLRSAWPRPVKTIPGLNAYAAMAADPVPGAVLDLPLETRASFAQAYLLAAAFHQRPTAALPRLLRRQEIPSLERAGRALDAAIAAGDPAPLVERGFRYVVWHNVPGDSAEPTAAQVSAALGQPRVDGGVRWWLVE